MVALFRDVIFLQKCQTQTRIILFVLHGCTHTYSTHVSYHKLPSTTDKLESWHTNLEQEPLNWCQQLPPPYKWHNYMTSNKTNWRSPPRTVFTTLTRMITQRKQLILLSSNHLPRIILQNYSFLQLGCYDTCKSSHKTCGFWERKIVQDRALYNVLINLLKSTFNLHCFMASRPVARRIGGQPPGSYNRQWLYSHLEATAIGG